MANVDAAVSDIMSCYDDRTSTTRMTIEEAIETTEGLVDELRDRLDALRADAGARTRG